MTLELSKQKTSSLQVYEGVNGTQYRGILDAFHGESHLPPHERVQEEILRSRWLDEGIDFTSTIDLSSGTFSYGQSVELQELAAEKLFDGLWHPVDGVRGIRVHPSEVITCPSSSLTMLEAAVLAVRRPNGVVLCPQGFYKSVKPHIEKFGMRIVTSSLIQERFSDGFHESTFKIDPVDLKELIEQYAASEELSAVLLTLPGNPVAVSYTVDELKKIATVLVNSKVPIICDMAFDKLIASHIPIASIEVPDATGRMVRMYDRTLSITGTSKGFGASGDWKMGAACSGDGELLERVQSFLPVGFSPEKAHQAGLFLEYTDEEYFQTNRALMIRQQQRAREHVYYRINPLLERLGEQALTLYGLPEGLFGTLGFSYGLLSRLGMTGVGSLGGMIYRQSGIDNVPLDRTGSLLPGVRFNIFAPRRGDGLWPGPGDKIDDSMRETLQDELFDRLGGWMLRAIKERKVRL